MVYPKFLPDFIITKSIHNVKLLAKKIPKILVKIFVVDITANWNLTHFCFCKSVLEHGTGS